MPFNGSMLERCKLLRARNARKRQAERRAQIFAINNRDGRQLVRRERERIAFGQMSRALVEQERALKHERYVTAMLGIKTSWPRIREHAIRFGI